MLSARKRKRFQAAIRRVYKANNKELAYLLADERIEETSERVKKEECLYVQNRILHFNKMPEIIKKTDKEKKPIESNKIESKTKKRHKIVSEGSLVGIAARIPAGDMEKMEMLAGHWDRSVSWLVRKAVSEYLEKNVKDMTG